MAERESDLAPRGSDPAGKHFGSASDLSGRPHRRLFVTTVAIQMFGFVAFHLLDRWVYQALVPEPGPVWVIVSTGITLALAFGVANLVLWDFRYSEASILRESAPAAESAFSELVDEWHKERGATSSITAMAMCPSYQKIIGLGPSAIPLIMRRMEVEGSQPDMWFWALRVLTGADPVADADRGDIVRMARAWLRWGRERYAW